MLTRLGITAALCLGAATATTAAQQRPTLSTAATQTPAAAPQPAGGMNAAVVNLQTEMAALELLNDLVGTKKADSAARITQMQAFMKEKNLSAAFDAFTPKTSFQPLTFKQAYQAALEKAQQMGPPQSRITDLDTLTREVAATTTLVQGSWNQLNQNLSTVHGMTEFLDTNGSMNDYLVWAKQYNAAQKQAEADQLAKNRAAAQQDALERQARGDRAVRELQKKLDSMPYSTGVDYNYTFSQGVQPGSQTGFYQGTFFNGYADPYYDVQAANSAFNFSNFGPQTGWGGWNNYWGGAYPANYDSVDAWNRSRDPVYRPRGAGDGGGAGAVRPAGR